MIGKKFGMFEVLGEIKLEKPGRHYECMCRCGNIRIKAGTELRAGRGKQCTDCQYREMYDTSREIGNRYGKWTVIKFLQMNGKHQQYETKCDCGTIGKHNASELRAKKSSQCVNCHNKQNALLNTKHGMHKERIYKVWNSMRQRCVNPKTVSYEWYGARGIKVCSRWNNFMNFYIDMGDREDGMTLDRIDNDGDYEPSNCRWVSHKENCQNRAKRK